MILKEKLTLKKAIALLCSFAGVVVLSFGGSNEGGGRWIGFVKTTDKNSMIAETEDKALTGAVL